MDNRIAKREHKQSFTKSGGGGGGSSSSKHNGGYMSTGTTPVEDSILAQNFQAQDLQPFHHPSFVLLKQNGFTQQLYGKFRKRCLEGNLTKICWYILESASDKIDKTSSWNK
jgi:hypothetical protein